MRVDSIFIDLEARRFIYEGRCASINSQFPVWLADLVIAVKKANTKPIFHHCFIEILALSNEYRYH